MEQKRVLAIVLRSVPFQDRHRVVTALTESHGQVSALAKNSVQSRRFGGALEPFAASEWFFSEKPGAELWSLNEAQIKRSYEGLRTDFERLSLASVLNEIMLRLAPQHHPAPELFKLHSNALALLEESKEPGADVRLLNAYLAKLLQWSGAQPQLVGCLGCGLSLEELALDAEVSCHVADAGWVCPACRRDETHHVREAGGMANATRRVAVPALRDCLIALAAPIRQAVAVCSASRAQHEVLFRYLEALLAYHLPGFDKQPLKGLRFLSLESNLQPRPMTRR